MAMHTPPHPGEFILAEKLDVAPSTLCRILKGSSRVTPEMALRLSKALGRTSESWLSLQDAHDLWIARQNVDMNRVVPLQFSAV
jgi:addiction module HigA family antidote